MTQNNNYKNRSCLRPYLLGYSTKTHLKMGQKCSMPTLSNRRNRLNTKTSAGLLKPITLGSARANHAHTASNQLLGRVNLLHYFLQSVAVVFLALNIPFVAQAQAHQKWSVSQATLRCGSHDVAVITSCVEREKDLPYCFSQSLAFVQVEGDIKKNLLFSHRFNDGNQSFIESVSCFAIANKKFVAVQSTNFGNCKTCEWTDIFSETGKYVGSSKTVAHDKDFPRKKLGINFKKAVLHELSKEEPKSTVYFSRTN